MAQVLTPPPPALPATLQFANKARKRPARPDRVVWAKPPKTATANALSRYQSIPGNDGRRHLYLNDKMPTVRNDAQGFPLPIQACICQGNCGHAYAHLYGQHCGQPCCDEGRPCDECRLEASEERRAWIQREWGVELGARVPDPTNDRDDYRYSPGRLLPLHRHIDAVR